VLTPCDRANSIRLRDVEFLKTTWSGFKEVFAMRAQAKIAELRD
jgi:hypothetical protein